MTPQPLDASRASMSSTSPPSVTISPSIQSATSLRDSDTLASPHMRQQVGAGPLASLGPTAANGTSGAPPKIRTARKQHKDHYRPSGNGGNSGGNSRRSYWNDVDDDVAALQLLKNASNRRGRTSITHLLNYAAPLRERMERAYGGGGGFGSHSGGYSRSAQQRHRHYYGSVADNKARFVHANYRFVVSPLGCYAAQATDADEYLDWADVLQVLASTESQGAACPICLSEPVAPRMARCGHIFCLPCLMRYLHVSNADDTSSATSRATVTTAATGPATGSATGPAAVTATTATSLAARRAKWKKCPICEEGVRLDEVCPVRFYAGQESPLPRPGDDVVLRLMLRHAHSTVALPRESSVAASTGDPNNKSHRKKSTNSSGSSIPWHFAANVLDYARIMRGTGDYMVEEFGRELDDLARQEREDELLYHEDGEWARRAMRAVRTAQDSVRELGGLSLALQDGSLFQTPGSSEKSSINSQHPQKGPVGAELAAVDADTIPPPAQQAAAVAAPTAPAAIPIAATARNTATSTPPHAPPSDEQRDFFFYASPPHLYLAPLDIRILRATYGTYSAFPSTLLPRVEHISTGHVVDDALRRRAKYLGHLPAGCVVSFIECDWTDVIPAETLAAFAGDLQRRRTRNRDKAAQEERERLHAERRDAAALQCRRNGLTDDWLGADDVDPSPPLDWSEFQPLGATPGHPADPPSLSAVSAASSSSLRPPSGPSPAQRTTVWGTRAAAPAEEVGSRAGGDRADVDVDDGWLKDDEVLGTLAGLGRGHGLEEDAALAAQLQALGVESTAPASHEEPPAGKKKKKKQKITLMSTGMRRGL